MRRRTRSLVSLALLLGLAAAFGAAPAHANTIYGMWRSSSGNVFEIPAGGGHHFDMVLTWTTGKREMLRGTWVRGLQGTQFFYFHNQVRYTGTFSARDANRIRVESTGGTASWWVRHVANPAWQRAVGTWRSTSGNLFEIPKTVSHTFDIVLTQVNGQTKVLQGTWVAGLGGTQFVYYHAGLKHTATISANDPDRIRLETGAGQVSFWKRSHRRSQAMNAAGTWQSTSGNRFVVPAGRGPFNMIMTDQQGRKQVFRAYWVPGMEGMQFRYGNPVVTATFNPQTGKVMVVDGTGTTNFWTRLY